MNLSIRKATLIFNIQSAPFSHEIEKSTKKRKKKHFVIAGILINVYRINLNKFHNVGHGI